MKTLAGAFGAGVVAAAVAVATATAFAGAGDSTGRVGPWSLAISLAVLVAIAVVMGVFGREFALIAVALCGVWATLSTVTVVGVVLDDTMDLLGPLIVVLGACTVVFFVAWFGWFIGTIVCVSTGHFTSRDLSEIAYARSGRSAPDSTSVYDDALDELARRHAGSDRVVARSMAIERRPTWHRPLTVVATDRQLVLAPIDTDGELGDDVLSIPTYRLAEGSVRSLRRDGTIRRSLSSHDDVVAITTSDGTRTQFVLAYEARVRTGPNAGADPVGGAGSIRHWIRTNATTYH